MREKNLKASAIERSQPTKPLKIQYEGQSKSQITTKLEKKCIKANNLTGLNFILMHSDMFTIYLELFFQIALFILPNIIEVLDLMNS